jgi:hypothetical protein
LVDFHYEKRGVLQLDLQLSFWVAMTNCNSLYFYTNECYKTSCMSCKRCNLTCIQSHYGAPHCNWVVTTMQFPYDYNYNVTLTSFFIQSSKFNTWHYEDVLVNFFWNINIHCPLWLFILNGFRLWHVAQ